MDDNGASTSSTIKKILQGKLVELQQSMKYMSISQNELWCTIFSSEGYTKY
jgi:hypothetical protein